MRRPCYAENGASLAVAARQAFECRSRKLESRRARARAQGLIFDRPRRAASCVAAAPAHRHLLKQHRARRHIRAPSCTEFDRLRVRDAMSCAVIDVATLPADSGSDAAISGTTTW